MGIKHDVSYNVSATRLAEMYKVGKATITDIRKQQHGIENYLKHVDYSNQQ